MIWGRGGRTFGHLHGVAAAKKVSDEKFVALLLTEPVVAGEVVPEVGSNHVCDHHSVQVPAGTQTCVVMFDPGRAGTHKKKNKNRQTSNVKKYDMRNTALRLLLWYSSIAV